jgi:hypothetical protein
MLTILRKTARQTRIASSYEFAIHRIELAYLTLHYRDLPDKAAPAV